MEVRIAELTGAGAPYVVEIDGDVDIATVIDLEQPVIGAIEAGRRPVIIDLSGCAFMDSSGLRLLLRAHHALKADGDGEGMLAVVARDHVARLLGLTGVDKAIAVVASRAEAESSVARGVATA